MFGRLWAAIFLVNMDMLKLQNSIGWFEIYVTDLERAKKFYEYVFQIKLTPQLMLGDFDSYVFPGDSYGFGSRGAIVKNSYRTPSHQGTIVYFASINCSEPEARVIDAGGQIIRGKRSVGAKGYVSIVEDTEGNHIGLHSFC